MNINKRFPPPVVRIVISSTGLISFGGDVCSFGGDGSFHEEHQADQGERDNGENKKCIEVGEGRGLFGS